MRFRSRFSQMLAVASLGGAALIWAQNPGGAPAGGSAPTTSSVPGGPGATGPAGPGAGTMDTPMQAAKELPALQEHLAEAKELNKQKAAK